MPPRFETTRSSKARRYCRCLQHFVEDGGRIEVCGISMQRRGVSADNLLPFCQMERNVFVSSIALQNRGYALMQVE